MSSFHRRPPLVVTASEVQVAWDEEICISDTTQSQHAPHDSDTAPAMTEEHDAARGASSHNRLMRRMIYAGFSQGRPDRQRHLVIDEGEFVGENILPDVGIQEAFTGHQNINGT